MISSGSATGNAVDRDAPRVTGRDPHVLARLGRADHVVRQERRRDCPTSSRGRRGLLASSTRELLVPSSRARSRSCSPSWVIVTWRAGPGTSARATTRPRLTSTATTSPRAESVTYATGSPGPRCSAAPRSLRRPHGQPERSIERDGAQRQCGQRPRSGRRRSRCCAAPRASEMRVITRPSAGSTTTTWRLEVSCHKRERGRRPRRDRCEPSASDGRSRHSAKRVPLSRRRHERTRACSLLPIRLGEARQRSLTTVLQRSIPSVLGTSAGPPASYPGHGPPAPGSVVVWARDARRSGRARPGAGRAAGIGLGPRGALPQPLATRVPGRVPRHTRRCRR